MTYRADYLVSAPPEAVTFGGPSAVSGEVWVYYHLAKDGSVLYIGHTSQPAARTRQHAVKSLWYDQIDRYIWFGPLTKFAAWSIERELIETEQPPHNVKFTHRDPMRNRYLRPPTRLNAARERVSVLESALADAKRVLRQLEAEATA